MTVDRPYRHWTPSALAGELAAYENRKVELTAALEDQDDLQSRVELMTELTTANEVVDELMAELAERAIPPSVGPTSRSVVVTGEHERNLNDIPRPARPDAPPRVASSAIGPDAVEPRQAAPLDRRFWQGMFIGVTALIALGVAAYLLTRPESGPSDEVASESTDVQQDSSALEAITAVVRTLGGSDVLVEQRGSTIFLSGSAATDEMRRAIISSAQALAGDMPLDSSALNVGTPTSVAPAGGTGSDSDSKALQSEIDRLVAATPIIFASDQTQLTDLHQRVLNNVAAAMMAHPGPAVSVVGYTDNVGSDESNRQLSLARAESVRVYLTGKGVADGRLSIEAMGEEVSTGSEQLAILERRVEFTVAPSGAPAGTDQLRIAMIAPSDREDLAFTQSMADAIEVIATERGNVEVAITDNTFVPDEAAAAIRSYADQGYDLIIAHGSQFGPSVLEIAPEYPEVAFAWGTASDTFGLPNVYAYDAAAEEGGYVLGAMSAQLSETGTIGVVGPIEVGDAERYINGFRAGALAESPGTSVLVSYTGSFSDTAIAKDVASAHVAAGADVLTGSAQMVLGAVTVVIENDLLWFGTQANQAPLAPDLVGASQVYHWEVILRQIVADVDGGRAVARSYTANLANGGLVIEYNPAVQLSDAARLHADALAAAIAAGDLTIAVP